MLFFILFFNLLHSQDSKYFPITQDSKWIYDVASRDGKEKFVMEVMVEKPQVFENEIYSILTQQDKRGKMRQFIKITENGVFCKKIGVSKKFTPEASTVNTPPIPILYFPLIPGTTFHWEGKMKIAFVDMDVVVDGKILGFEKIKVPAGEFGCIKIFFKQKRGKDLVEETAWYAEGVGQVKYIGSKYIKELKSVDIKK